MQILTTMENTDVMPAIKSVIVILLQWSELWVSFLKVCDVSVHFKITLLMFFLIQLFNLIT